MQSTYNNRVGTLNSKVLENCYADAYQKVLQVFKLVQDEQMVRIH